MDDGGKDDDGPGGDDGKANDARASDRNSPERRERRDRADNDDTPGGAGVRGVSVGGDARMRDGDRDRSRPDALPADVDVDNEGRWVRANELLALEENARSLNFARSQGFVIVERFRLETLGLSVVRLQTPKGAPLRVSLERLRSGDPNTAYDFNHIYHLSQTRPNQARRKPAPAATPAAALPVLTQGAIGMIDGPVQTSHPALRPAVVEQRMFASGKATANTEHGTAVASLLVGQDGAGFKGGLPGARLLAGSVVSTASASGDLATADAMVKALDWLVAKGAPVINVSMAGPPNALVADAIKRTIRRGALVVAAVGNDGPAALSRGL